jgi:polar amino acid transport system substrate-binding protein
MKQISANLPKKFRQILLSLTLVPCAAQLALAADPVLTLVHNEKPPFFYSEAGQSMGMVVDVVRNVMNKAGLAHRFESRPFSRIMHEFQNADVQYCAIGFSRTPERERFVDFSLPIYKDKTPVFLVRRIDAPEFRRFKSLKSLFDESTLVFGGKAGNAYPIDKQLETLGARDVRINGEQVALVQMLNASRFDFMLVFPEERDDLISKAKLTGSSFVDISYPDIPPGGYRHLLCSKKLDPSILERINRAITSVVGKI